MLISRNNVYLHKLSRGPPPRLRTGIHNIRNEIRNTRIFSALELRNRKEPVFFGTRAPEPKLTRIFPAPELNRN